MTGILYGVGLGPGAADLMTLRAARLIEAMEAAGVVTEMGSNGQREVLAPPPPEA